MGTKASPRPPQSRKTVPSPSNPPKPLEYVSRARKTTPQSAFAKRPASSPAPPAPLSRARRLPLYAAGSVAGIMGLYIAFLGYSLANPYEPTHAVPADVSDRYDVTAARFDADVDSMERKTGIMRLRRQLVRRARGDVLEVSAGTGRNSAFYDGGQVSSLVLLDRSGPMLEEARRKWWELKKQGRTRVREVEFRTQSALEGIQGPGAARQDKGIMEKVKEKVKGDDGDGKFDTVVQTMGLCSTPEPEKLLQNMGEVIKPDGRILLLEHGKSFYDWLNRWLDKSAPGHADVHGCWWNKDIGAIVEKSGLQVVELSRPWYHLGTTWWVELKKRGAGPEPVQEKEGSVEKTRAKDEDVQVERKSWW